MSLIAGQIDTTAGLTLDINHGEASMALEIEKQFNLLFHARKGMDIPETGREDRQMLFVAISRGVLKYLKDNAAGNVRTAASSGVPARNVTFTIDLGA